MRKSVLLVAALVAAVVPAAAASSSTIGASAVVAPAGVLGHAGRWLIDGDGRVVIVHGINVPSKALPAYPTIGDSDATLLASAGLNAVRLTVERYAVEPTPGHFDDAYLAHVLSTVQMLAGHGIESLIDFHQDEYGPVFHDNGFPAWMTGTDGLPNLYQVGFPYQYLVNPALERAFDHLWANDTDAAGHPLQVDDAAIIGHVARYFKDAPGLLGYEIINEPWPGTVYPTCAVPVVGCPLFDRGPFSAYYARTIGAARAADPTHLVWYEPLTLFNEGIPTSVVTPPDPRLGFAFHDYGLCGASALFQRDCAEEDALVLSNAVARSRSTGDALLETEFGGTTDDPTIEGQVTQYDQNMIPWMYWAYPELPAVISTLARPYPQLISGTPTSWSFDPTTRVFAFRYTQAHAAGRGAFPAGSQTVIAVPSLAYPHGYHVRVTGGSVVSASASLVVASGPQAGPITVTVTPA